MFVIIAGGGRTGTQLAQLLLEEGHDVCVVEYRPEVLARLHKDIPTEAIFEGFATEGRILEIAGIRKAHVLAACLANDADNLVVCYLARQVYQVQRTIARINNPRNAWLFNKKFHVDVALNHSEVMARLIEEEMSLGDMMTLLKLRQGEYSIVEEKIPAGAKAIGVAIKDLALPEDCVIAAIIRRGKIVVPRGATILEKEDEILAIANRQGAAQLSALFARPAGK